MNKESRARLLVAKKIIQAELDIEQNKLDNLPESLQYAKVGEDIQEAIEWLEEARDALNEVGV